MAGLLDMNDAALQQDSPLSPAQQVPFSFLMQGSVTDKEAGGNRNKFYNYAGHSYHTGQ